MDEVTTNLDHRYSTAGMHNNRAFQNTSASTSANCVDTGLRCRLPAVDRESLKDFWTLAITIAGHARKTQRVWRKVSGPERLPLLALAIPGYALLRGQPLYRRPAHACAMAVRVTGCSQTQLCLLHSGIMPPGWLGRERRHARRHKGPPRSAPSDGVRSCRQNEAFLA